MNRLAILTTLTIAAVAVLCIAGPATASAAACSPSAAGGEKAPDVAGDNSINEAASQGYSCTVQWQASVQPQYESGGVWHLATEAAPIFHPGISSFYAAGSSHNWGLFDWFATQTADTPACAFNWRLQVNFFNSSKTVFAADVSPQTAKTC